MLSLFRSGRDFLVAGLGNPGDKYAATRHNAGFCAADYIARREGLSYRSRFGSLYADFAVGGRRGFLQKPQTFMNASGSAVAQLARYYRIEPGRIIIMHDDITLPPGRFKIKSGGSDGGHNGLSSVISSLGSWDFIHLKIGIGAKEHKEQPLADYVLADMPAADREAFEASLEDIYGAVLMLIKGETEQAKARYNHAGAGANA